MQSDSTSTRTVRELCRVLFRFRRRAMALFVVTLAVVAIGLLVAPRKYESAAKLFVRVGRESVSLDPTATTTGSVIQLNSSREAEIQAVVEVLRSRTVLEKTAQQLTPAYILAKSPESLARYTPAKQLQKAVAELEETLHVGTAKDSTVVSATLESTSPERAQKTLDTLLDVYLGEHLRINRIQGSHEFFLEQSELLRKQLEAASAELRDAKNDYGIVTVEGRRQSLQTQITTVEADLLTTQAALSALEAKIGAARQRLAHLPATVVSQFIDGLPNEAGSDLYKQLYTLQVREQEILSKVTLDHPAAIAIRQQVEEVERLLGTTESNSTRATEAAMLTEQVDADSLRARLTALAQQQAGLQAELRELNVQEIRLAELQRKVELLEADYRQYARNLEQTRMDQELRRERISNVNIIQPPSFVQKPTQPRTLLTLALGLLAATGGALGLAIVSDQLDTSLKTPEDVERTLRLPIVMTIPEREQQRVFCV